MKERIYIIIFSYCFGVKNIKGIIPERLYLYTLIRCVMTPNQLC